MRRSLVLTAAAILSGGVELPKAFNDLTPDELAAAEDISRLPRGDIFVEMKTPRPRTIEQLVEAARAYASSQAGAP